MSEDAPASVVGRRRAKRGPLLVTNPDDDSDENLDYGTMRSTYNPPPLPSPSTHSPRSEQSAIQTFLRALVMPTYRSLSYTKIDDQILSDAATDETVDEPRDKRRYAWHRQNEEPGDSRADREARH